MNLIVIINQEAGAAAQASEGFSPAELAGEFSALGAAVNVRVLAPRNGSA